MVESIDGRSRAFVQVQNGCDHRCTFCIIPYGRGNSRSVPAGEVVSQVRRLSENGYLEVVLTGVDLTSWGGDLPGTPRLGRLVRSILREVPQLQRLRLSSIDSIEADELLLDTIATESRFMPHLHLSMQHGDDMILKRMKRRHDRDDSIRFCEEVRRLRPDIALGADLIAGFPTEDETMFENSLSIIEACGLVHLHVFPFSPRPGTPAARMPQLDRSLIKERASRLRAAGDAAYSKHLARQQDKVLPVLLERQGMGRTPQFTPTRLSGGPDSGIVDIRIVGMDGNCLVGESIAAEIRGAA
jgi:threonylcarbamoyladenosine tRNA methylthiotransferase MtaB